MKLLDADLLYSNVWVDDLSSEHAPFEYLFYLFEECLLSKINLRSSCENFMLDTLQVHCLVYP
jgi:hypothetical protein